MSQYRTGLTTPIGQLLIEATDQGVSKVIFSESIEPEVLNLHTEQALVQLTEYFAGKRKEFDLTLDAQGTPFRQRVWQALHQIAYGHTASYRDIAESIDNPKAVRAVGAANGANPISIIVPCHRIVGADGSLTGYAGGLERKKWLLEFEQQH